MTLRVVSVSLGSRSRDYEATVELLGQQVRLQRIGTDGDVAKATALYEELDGQVDCFGVGGAVLHADALDRRYAFPAVFKMLRNVTKTPFVDGSGFKNVMERRVGPLIRERFDDFVSPQRALVTSAADRLGLAQGIHEAGYEMLLGDLGFALGVPIAMRSFVGLNRFMHTLGPIVRHMPMSMLYPSGEEEDENTPRFGDWFAQCGIIAGDGNYITRYMPLDMRGKIVATNTTTARDVRLYRERGVTYLITSTPRLGERTFGTNVMEATLVALSGQGGALSPQKVAEMIKALGWAPNVEELNPPT